MRSRPSKCFEVPRVDVLCLDATSRSQMPEYGEIETDIHVFGQISVFERAIIRTFISYQHLSGQWQSSCPSINCLNTPYRQSSETYNDFPYHSQHAEI